MPKYLVFKKVNFKPA